jgi:hypothetical protein
MSKKQQKIKTVKMSYSLYSLTRFTTNGTKRLTIVLTICHIKGSAPPPTPRGEEAKSRLVGM